MEAKTGLKVIRFEGVDRPYLGKTHRGYETLFRIQAGNVWGRWAARVAMGEAGRELGGIWSFLTGSYEHVSSVTGSPLDRLLSEIIGQPISMLVVLDHNKPDMPRLDVYNMFSTIKPYDPQPEIKYIGLHAGTMYSSDRAFAATFLADKEFVERLSNFRSMYIRADKDAVSFLFAASENEYSGMINNFGGYHNFINAILETLADIADAG
ncbi:MAG: hypothetical protein J5J00_17505 [Deltaproteobacteria bacterium]|nr:hypothetical protein [Deltaproteobacteria bacterium]